MRFNLIARPQPLIGIILVAAGWALSHQWGSNAVFDDCTANGNGTVIVVSVLGLLITAAGGAYCALAWRGKSSGDGRGFLGLVGALLALMASFAIILQLAAGLILPACAA